MHLNETLKRVACNRPEARRFVCNVCGADKRKNDENEAVFRAGRHLQK